ncbi:afadin-and alpha-actinin-binding protein [Elysia marginata]|uniref:Afadin-and alpha-actinin-binding protein n=1 Tax=Elysia marginata TaxID=1093978 RepID=A0AAV4GDY8_9GAST|nr:afadin-and alpha-actinin-binding protein [Elysia marginata]
MDSIKIFYAAFILLHLAGIKTTQGKKQKPETDFIGKEITLLDKTTKCNQAAVSRSAVHMAWMKNQVDDEVVLCCLKFLNSSPEDAFVWALIGTSYDKRSAKKKADFCFQQSTKLSGKHSKFVKDWYYIAPFVIGKTEFDGDPLFSQGGIFNISKFRVSTKPALKLFSELTPKGLLGWAKVRQSQSESLVQVRPAVDWNDLVSSLGSLGITEWQGWALGDLVINEGNLPLAFQCLGVSRCYINNTMTVGDLYHRDYFWNSMVLPRGVHTVFIPLRAKVTASFKFLVTSELPQFQIFQPSFLPDLYEGYFPSKMYIAVPICNSMPQKWLKLTRVEVWKQSEGRALEALLVDSAPRIAPGQTTPVTVELLISDTSKDGNIMVVNSCKENSIELDLKFKTSEGTLNLNLKLRCRHRGSSFLFTFIDHDGSVQQTAAIEPLGYRSSKQQDPCPVVLSLHGTTVSPQNQADSYKKMVDGEFKFGVKDMWLLAPTRHGAHNWEGPGTLTAMAALENLAGMSRDKAIFFTCQADPTRVVFAGHSMGGHGAWHLATHFPDRAVGLVSLAGWIKKEEYGDSNLFYRHDISNSYVDPSLKSIMEACVAENDVDRHTSNLKGVPVLARIGANDRTVHPFYVRRMVRVLKAAGVDVTYSELPGLEHWWWDTKEENDGGCVNDGQIRTFLDQIRSNLNLEAALPVEESGACSKDDDGEGCKASDYKSGYLQEEGVQSQTVTLEVFNPALGEGLKGVHVLQQLIQFRRSSLEIYAEGDFASLKTQNVGCLKIRNTTVPNRSFDLHKVKTLKIDSTTITPFHEITSPYTFCRNLGTGQKEWVHTPGLYQGEAAAFATRGPHNYGPARRVAERPFIIVYGTTGDESTSALLLQHSVYIANQFFATSDTSVSIKGDADIGDTDFENNNLIIIGGPVENSKAEHFLTALPHLKLDFKEGPQLMLGDSCEYKEERTGILTLAPHGSKGLALLLMGLSQSGLEDVVKLATPTIPPMARSPFSNLLPDFVITGPDTGLKGPGGFLCAGSWDNTWRFASHSASCACEA